MKFSIIIPVYNVEKYLVKCLNSVASQTYNNYEVIIICDKCDDNSEEIVDDYVNKDSRFKKIYKENTGLSTARNIGVKKATGDYLLFLDGDDYFEENILETLNNNISSEVDIIRFQAQEVTEGRTIKHSEDGFEKMTGIEAFNIIINYHYVENSWLYCYNRKFFIKNNFSFMENCIAEDFGLTPLIISKAKSIIGLDYIGYNYIQRKNSLMSNKDYKSKIKKADDMIKQGNFLKKTIPFNKETRIFVAFINNSIINYITTLKYNDYRRYNKYLKKNKYYNHFKITGLTTLKSTLLIKFNAYFYYNKIVRKNEKNIFNSTNI